MISGRLTVFAWEQWPPFQHLGEDAACAPDVNGIVILLPCQHDLWGAIVPRRYISRHLRILQSSETKIADFEITVLVDKNVGGFLIMGGDFKQMSEGRQYTAHRSYCPE